jgi:hypothetical protein
VYASEAIFNELARDPSYAWQEVGPLELRSIGAVPALSLRSAT